MFTKLTRIGLLGLAATALLSVGCDRAKAPPAGRVDELPAGQYPHIVAADELAPKLVFGPAIVDASTTDHPMRVTQPGRSLHDKQVRVQYMFEFLDDRGRPLKSNLGWRFMNLEPRREVFFEAAAMDTAAVDWRLVVRPAR